ncbi:hypothetical protein STMMW_19262 [Salmonella enterica subsp. enterica serovar Typhimurium str. D23580]|uniref:Uncharacterized protein n=1 Tax=Salmonella typhimurium (strain D23580) TaxID=568708 RepID=A0A6C7IBD0_SALTD|nr:hypothetical protein STMMW_19262 [Salmonella enterica subsp. enterica serovar Typhimurium str. D23580]
MTYNIISKNESKIEYPVFFYVSKLR